jgi:predicted nucleotidyltransferase
LGGGWGRAVYAAQSLFSAYLYHMMFPKLNIIENQTAPVITRPFAHLDEIAAMQETVMGSLKDELKVPRNVLNSFNIKDSLNPDFWTDYKLNPQVQTRLLKLANSFFKELELPPNIKMKDILFVGSLANFNWSKFSDIDLHIVVDFDEFEEGRDFIKKHFDAEKKLWNDKHEIKMFGYPVEIYIQDTKEKLSAAAVYSILTNKWKLKPEKESFKIDKALIKRKVQKIFDKIKNIKDNYDDFNFDGVIDKVTRLKATIKQMRQSGLEKGGEFSTENLVFKVLRRTEFMDIIDSFKNKAYDAKMSLEEEIP